MKKYNKKKNQTNIVLWLIGEIILVFVVATASIVLYDMYINIDVAEYNSYIPEKVVKEVNTENTEYLSEMLESVSKSVVRYI